MKRALQTNRKQESLAKRRVRDRESYAALNAGDKKDVLQARSKAYADKMPDDKTKAFGITASVLCGEKSRRQKKAFGITASIVRVKKPDEKHELLQGRRESYSALSQAHARCERGRNLRREGDLRGAESEFREAIKIDRRYIDAHILVGMVLASKGNLRGAEAQYRATPTMFPRCFVAHFNFAILLEERGKPAEAEAEYRAAICIDPSSACAHCNLAIILHDKGDLAEAEVEYHAATEIDPIKCFAPALALFLAAK